VSEPKTVAEFDEINRRVAVAVEYDERSRIPSFTHDSGAADFLRREIDKRGWDCYIYGMKGRHWTVAISDDVGLLGSPSQSNISPHIALCLAFLAAIEVGSVK
jgi:hypothetical protein